MSGAVKVTDADRPDAFFLRGFLVTSRDYRKDGFLDPTYTPRDFADVQRVEILQGPASVLDGAGQPSGSVNLITKNPLAERMQDVTHAVRQLRASTVYGRQHGADEPGRLSALSLQRGVPGRTASATSASTSGRLPPRR